MIFRQLFERESSTYTYLVACEKTHHAVLIDTVKSEVNLYLQLLEELSLKLVFVLDTHTHADHITGAGALRDAAGAISLLGKEANSNCVSQTICHNQIIHIGKIDLKALYTPGHTDDSYSFVIEEEQQPYLFFGDTLLIRGTGRTDFQNGNAAEQYDSLFRHLLKLPDNTLVYPGHDYKGWTVSTIAEEKEHNPRLQVRDLASYVELMNNLKLPNPKMMDIAVPANLACGKNESSTKL